ncbi:MAG: TetR/AcrR family transcriptional regulator [Anaerolineae bacterium]|jgi:AcrR family transcriptional regulator
MAKTQKQLQSERTQGEIIEAAARFFVRKGFYGTSIADLAQATGLTKGALYHHFENKDALFFAVIKRVRDVWSEAVVCNVLEAQDALTRLTTLLDNHARLIDENDTLCLVLNGLMLEMDGVNPAFMTALEEIYAELVLFIERIIKKGQKTGQIRSDLDARLMALNIAGMLKGSGCSRPMFERLDVDYATVMETMKQLLLDGLRP